MTKYRTQTHRTGNLPPRSNFCLTTARSRFQKGLPAWSRVSHLRPASLISCIRLCRESRQSWAEVGRACSEGSLRLLRELARLWTSFSSLDSRPSLFRRRIDMAHPCERVSMYVLLKACQEYGTVQGSRRTDGGREEGGGSGWFTLEGSPCSFCKSLSCLIPWRDSGAYRLGGNFLR